MNQTTAWFSTIIPLITAVGVANGWLHANQNSSDCSTTVCSWAAVLSEQEDEEVALPELRDELAKRVKVDQAARSELIEVTVGLGNAGKNKSGGGLYKKLAIVQKLKKIDNQNREWLKKQVDKHGWLGKSKVGKQGAHDAWLLVQHADNDLEFQKRCLKLMQSAKQGEVAKVDIAYLTDRILNAEGKPQRYGTQCVIEEGKAVVKNVADRENLDNRRKELGLGPIDEYLRQIEEVYKAQPKPEKVND